MNPSRRIPLQEAEGRTAVEALCPYPPGIPLVWPGEMIHRESLSYIQAVLNAGGTVTGVGAKREVAVI